MSAPVRFAASVVAATTISSIVSSSVTGRSKRRNSAEERRAADVDERAPDVALHQHDRGEHDVADDVANQPVEGFELKAAREVEHPDEHGDADRHLHRVRAANQLEHLVDDDRHDQ